jgi:lysophospholipid hydrolase
MASPDAAQMADALSRSLAQTMTSPSDSVAAVMSTPSDVMAAQASQGWLGFLLGLFGRFIINLLNLTSTTLYWTIRIATIKVPSILFTLFSTSWTVTMNATTL